MKPRDFYSDLDSLKRELVKNRDYRIRWRNKRSSVTIIAPHGGYVESGTSAIANAIAGREYNFFDFQGLRRERVMELHVTATHFRDPVLSKMLDGSVTALSVHSMGEEGDMTIWLGGLNRELKERVRQSLVAHGFLVNPDSPKYRGEHPKNVVNLAACKGVQIELPGKLIASMFRGNRLFSAKGRCSKTTEVFERFIKAVREPLAGSSDLQLKCQRERAQLVSTGK